MFNPLSFRVKFAFCSVVLGAIFALTGAAFAAENFADVAADKNAVESGDAKIGEGFRYSEFLQHGDFHSSTKTDSLSHPFSLNPEPFDLPAGEFGAAEGGGGLIEFISSPLGGFVIAAGIFAGATAIDKNNRDDNNTPSASNTPPSSGGENGGTNPTTPQQCTAPGEISDGSGGCRCDTANNYMDDGNGNCVMQTATPQCTAPGEIPDGSGGCQCDTANNYVDDGAGMCVMQQVCTGQMVADGIGGCECPTGMVPDTGTNDPNDCRPPTDLEMCGADSSLQRRVFERASGTLVFPQITYNLALSIEDNFASRLTPVSSATFYVRRPDGTYESSNGFVANLPQTAKGDPVVGDVVAITLGALGGEAANILNSLDSVDLFRVYRDPADGELYLARGERTDQRATQCAAADAGSGFFFLDDSWEPTQVRAESRTDFPFNLREGLRGLLNEKRAVRLKNFFFTANDSQLRDFHLEHRFHLFGEANESATGESPDPSGFSAFAESGYKRQNGGRTALHYNKLTAIRDFTSGFAVYAQGISGRINSEIYRNTRLRGFAAGVFADKVLSHDDSYHLRIESPLSAPQIARTRMAIDARIGEPENYWRVGFYRGLEEKKSAAKLFWLREF
ncbi:MAG: hypothetical protein ACR2QC_08440 [Gammaproteobacteria bacterium]